MAGFLLNVTRRRANQKGELRAHLSSAVKSLCTVPSAAFPFAIPSRAACPNRA